MYDVCIVLGHRCSNCLRKQCWWKICLHGDRIWMHGACCNSSTCTMYDAWYMRYDFEHEVWFWCMMYDEGCMVCDVFVWVWCVMCDVCLQCVCLMCDVYVVYDVWCMIHDGTMYMYDVWCMMNYVWCMMYDVWYMMYDTQQIAQKSSETLSSHFKHGKHCFSSRTPQHAHPHAFILTHIHHTPYIINRSSHIIHHTSYIHTTYICTHTNITHIHHTYHTHTRIHNTTKQISRCHVCMCVRVCVWYMYVCVSMVRAVRVCMCVQCMCVMCICMCM